MGKNIILYIYIKLYKLYKIYLIYFIKSHNYIYNLIVLI